MSLPQKKLELHLYPCKIPACHWYNRFLYAKSSSGINKLNLRISRLYVEQLSEITLCVWLHACCHFLTTLILNTDAQQNPTANPVLCML